MLSGLGHKQHLQSLGIPVVIDLPVGDNYQNQPAVSITVPIKAQYSTQSFNPQLNVQQLNMLYYNYTNYLAVNPDVTLYHSTRTNRDKQWPNIMTIMIPISDLFTPIGCPTCPGKYAYQCLEGLQCYMRYKSETSGHPGGSCRMGAIERPDVVVDPLLRVKGINRLRVCDSSVFPVVPNTATASAALTKRKSTMQISFNHPHSLTHWRPHVRHQTLDWFPSQTTTRLTPGIGYCGRCRVPLPPSRPGICCQTCRTPDWPPLWTPPEPRVRSCGSLPDFTCTIKAILNMSTVSVTKRCKSSSLVTSANTCNTAETPVGDTSMHCLATSATLSPLRPVTTTLAPDLANSTAVAAPMPELEPVTSATLPLKSNFRDILRDLLRERETQIDIWLKLFARFALTVDSHELNNNLIKWYRIFSYWADNHISGPKPLPYFGNSLSLILRPKPLVELEWYKTYGPVYGKYNCGKPELSVADPALIKQIMVKDFHKFHNRGVTRVDEGMNTNLFSSRDEHWKRIRAIASPTFTSSKLKDMYPVVNECCRHFLAALDRDVSTGRTEVELKALMAAYTIDVMGSCVFSAHTDSYTDPNNPFTTKTNWILKNFSNLSTDILTNILPTFVTKWLATNSLSNMMFFMHLSGRLVSERKHAVNKPHDLLQYEEREDTTTTVEDSVAADAMIGHHLKAGVDELMAEKRALSGVVAKKLTEEEVIAQSVLFFFGGVESTASTLSFCTYELALNPDIQDELVAETSEAFNEDTGDIDYDTVSRLPLLDAVISETLRKYPPGVNPMRETAEDVMLTTPNGSAFMIKKGVNIDIPVYAIHHSPDNYPDPEAFKPDRFLPQNRHHIKPYTYLPFGAGPRHCIGMRFGLLEIKLAMVKLLRQFRFYGLPTTDAPVVFSKGRVFLHSDRLRVGVAKR
ncbi:unnamed protein product, partial [Medioppia subpectinata]